METYEMDTATRVQILDEVVCISHTFEKFMHATILFSVWGK